MKTLDLVQGSDEWLDARAKHFTASEAPVMMGASKKATRNDLLRMKATGDEQEFNRWVKEVLFERGHEVEAKARPIAEAIVGEELYPATATDDEGYLLASFDGITMLGDVVWECKQWNAAKAKAVDADHVPDEDVWQIVQQLLVSGAEKALYMVSDGTEEGTAYCWMHREDADFDALLAGWKQFDHDLASYEPAPDVVQPAGAAPETLQPLRVEVTGMVTASNLAEYKEQALAVFGSINTDLQTDDDFADAEKTVKWCKDVEDRLEATKNHALSQTPSIDELFRAIDDLREEARAKRVHLDKLVKSRKQAIRDEILRAGKQAFDAHLGELERSIEEQAKMPIRLDSACTPPDFAAAMKGKKTVKSLRDAVDQELASAKIAANALADKVRGNLAAYNKLADGFETLFRDLWQLATKERDDFEAAVKSRIAEHKEAEQKRLDAERERIRAEEQRKAEQEARKDAEQAEPRSHGAGSKESAPKASSRSAPPRSFMMRLSDWQQAHEISDAAMDDLRAMLREHGMS